MKPYQGKFLAKYEIEKADTVSAGQLVPGQRIANFWNWSVTNIDFRMSELNVFEYLNSKGGSVNDLFLSLSKWLLVLPKHKWEQKWKLLWKFAAKN